MTVTLYYVIKSYKTVIFIYKSCACRLMFIHLTFDFTAPPPVVPPGPPTLPRNPFSGFDPFFPCFGPRCVATSSTSRLARVYDCDAGLGMQSTYSLQAFWVDYMCILLVCWLAERINLVVMKRSGEILFEFCINGQLYI